MSDRIGFILESHTHVVCGDGCHCHFIADEREILIAVSCILSSRLILLWSGALGVLPSVD
jgi:alpha-acetolactate decarboxylase